jgi:hypothetical protein
MAISRLITPVHARLRLKMLTLFDAMQPQILYPRPPPFRLRPSHTPATQAIRSAVPYPPEHYFVVLELFWTWKID